MADLVADQATKPTSAAAMRAAPFASILYEDGRGVEKVEQTPQPEHFRDLNLDQLFAAVCAANPGYRLEPFFRSALSDAAAVEWRQEIVRDLMRPEIRNAIDAFAASLRAMHDALAQKDRAYYALEKQRWFLDAIMAYCEAAVRLRSDLLGAKPDSSGLRAFVDFLTRSTNEAAFLELAERARAINSELASIRYRIAIEGARVEVRDDHGEPDYGSEIEQAFARFNQGGEQERFDFPLATGMSQLDEKVLELVAKLHPGTFAALANFFDEVADFADPLILRFEREIQFYLAFLRHLAPLEQAGLRACLPGISRGARDVEISSGYDLALAGNLAAEDQKPVTNDARLGGQERILIVSGPNQGGKTTFARMVGQIHYLAALGLPVPASAATVPLFDALFTHFEREESLSGPGGKLKDDIVRVHAIVERATADGFIIFNEIFTSTTLEDASRLSGVIAERIRAAGALCLWVTFLDELAELGPEFVSMVAEVSPDDPSIRTFKVVRRPPTGVAYALSIAEKYGLTYERLMGRLLR